MRTLLCAIVALITISSFGATIPASTSSHAIYASQVGAKLNSNVTSGGGTDDSAALQYGLDISTNYTAYQFIIDGPALISTNLVIRSNTKLTFLPGAGLFMKSHANCWPLGNFPNTNYSTTNIVIEGGFINCNGNAQAEYITNGFKMNGAPQVCGMWLAGVDGATVRGTTLMSAKCYNFLISDSRHVFLNNVSVLYTNNVASGTNSLFGNDSVHLQCNVTDFRLDGLYVNGAGDDVVDINTDETDFTLPFNDPRWTINSGSVSNVLFENIITDNCKNFCRLTCQGGFTNAHIYNFTLRHYRGGIATLGLRALAENATPTQTIAGANWLFDDIAIDATGSFDGFGLPMFDFSGTSCDQVTLSNIRLTDRLGAGIGSTGLIQLRPTITNVVMSNVYIEGSANNIAAGDCAIALPPNTTNTSYLSVNNLTVFSFPTIFDTLNGSGQGVPSLGFWKVSNIQYDKSVSIMNGGGFTNMMNGNEPKFISTNWVSGKLYTNVSGALQYVQCPVSVTTAAINGSARVEFVVGTGTTPLFTNAVFGSQTTGSSLAVTNLGTLTGYVLPSQMFYFSNSLVGAGDAARTLPNGQQVTY
jgi:hypothetical protein